jgi:hypothetical protein
MSEVWEAAGIQSRHGGEVEMEGEVLNEASEMIDTRLDALNEERLCLERALALQSSLPMSRPPFVGNMRSLAILAALLGALSILVVGVGHADAYTTLSLKTRQQIVHHADLPAPNHKGMIRRAACIEGRLSTVDRRWAMFFLTNTKACVRRYGGASGGAGLLERPSTNSVDWKFVGEIGEQGCTHGEDGASDAVLRDLGCNT